MMYAKYGRESAALILECNIPFRWWTRPSAHPPRGETVMSFLVTVWPVPYFRCATGFLDRG